MHTKLRNITLSADARVIDAARERARIEHSTLNAEFRRWLNEYARLSNRAQRAMDAVAELAKTIDTSGRKFTREELNER